MSDYAGKLPDVMYTSSDGVNIETNIPGWFTDPDAFAPGNPLEADKFMPFALAAMAIVRMAHPQAHNVSFAMFGKDDIDRFRYLEVSKNFVSCDCTANYDLPWEGFNLNGLYSQCNLEYFHITLSDAYVILEENANDDRPVERFYGKFSNSKPTNAWIRPEIVAVCLALDTINNDDITVEAVSSDLRIKAIQDALSANSLYRVCEHLNVMLIYPYANSPEFMTIVRP